MKKSLLERKDFILTAPWSFEINIHTFEACSTT